MVQYLFESAFCLACLYALYQVALRHQTFFQWNRVYLLLAPVFSLLVPALTIQLEKPPVLPQAAAPVWPEWIEQAQSAPLLLHHTLTRPVWAVSLGDVLWWVYLAGALVFGVRLLFKAAGLIVFIRRCRLVRQNGVRLATGSGDTLLASFFGIVFWHPQNTAPAEQDLMFEHELVHVRQWHSLDILLIEALLVVQWFNPLLFAYRRSLREIHEYIADAQVVRRTRQRYAYAQLLVQHLQSPVATPLLVNTFHSLIKNRLTMLAKQPSPPVHRLRYLGAFLLGFSLLGLFSFRLVEKVQAFAPIHTAVQKVENLAANLQTMPVLTGQPENLEDTPYIFYWGTFSCRIQKDPAIGQYSGAVSLTAEEFRRSVDREPRLWNGNSMETLLEFQLDGLAVRSDYQHDQVYGSLRKKLDDFAYTVKPGAQLRLTNLTLPNGQKAVIDLVFSGAAESFAPREAGEIVWSEPGNNTLSETAWGHLEWGQVLNSATNDRDFFTVAEFAEMIESAPQHYLKTGEPANLTQCKILFLPYKVNAIRDFDALEMMITHDRNDASVYEKHRQKLRNALRDFVQPGIFIFIEVTHVSDLPGVGAGTMRIVENGSPALALHHHDRNSFTLEWGALAHTSLKKYGRAFADKTGALRPIDIATQSTINVPVDEIKQLLDLQARLWENNRLLSGLQFRVQYQGKTAAYAEEKGLPAGFKSQVKTNLAIGDTLSISGFEASGSYLTNLTLHIIAHTNDPKPPQHSGRASGSKPSDMVLQAAPNPSPSGQTSIRMQLPEGGEGLLTVVDPAGAIRYSIKTEFQAGVSTFSLPFFQANASGLHYVRLEMPYGTGQTTLMINK